MAIALVLSGGSGTAANRTGDARAERTPDPEDMVARLADGPPGFRIIAASGPQSIGYVLPVVPRADAALYRREFVSGYEVYFKGPHQRRLECWVDVWRSTERAKEYGWLERAYSERVARRVTAAGTIGDES